MASCKDEAAATATATATATGSGSADDEGSGRIVDVPTEVEGDGDGEGGTEGPVDAGASAEEGAGAGTGEEPQPQQQPDPDPELKPPADPSPPAGGVEDRPPPPSTPAGDPVRTAEEGGIAAGECDEPGQQQQQQQQQQQTSSQGGAAAAAASPPPPSGAPDHAASSAPTGWHKRPLVWALVLLVALAAALAGVFAARGGGDGGGGGASESNEPDDEGAGAPPPATSPTAAPTPAPATAGVDPGGVGPSRAPTPRPSAGPSAPSVGPSGGPAPTVPNDDESYMPTKLPSILWDAPAPATPPTSSPVENLFGAAEDADALAAMQTIVRLSGKNSLRDPFSPQSRAAEWIVDRDPLAMRYDDPRFVQRYVLAVFYYAAGGGSWRNRFAWMSSKHECEWYGIDGASAGCGLEGESVGGCNRGDDGAGEYDRICRIGMGNGNNLYGQLPSELGYLSDMRFFQVQNDYLIGTVPGELGTSWTKLNTLLLGGNFLEGTFPETFGGNEMLGTVFVDRNKFRGTFPSLFGMLENLEWLDAEGNEFEGELPATVADLKSLRFLNVNNNSLSGPLPDGWDESNILEDLKISGNKLSGSFPASLGKVGSLKDLHASRNNISGIYPESYADLQNLKELYLDGNSLSGRFPVEYFESSEVIEVLSLHNNQLTGTITDSLCARRASSLTELTADCGLILCECCTCYEDGNLVSVFSSGDTSPTTSPVAVEGPPLEAIESISRPTRAPVSPVPDRDELAIRHHIESTVLQRNAAFDDMETDDPRSIALDWILHVDPRQLTINDSNLSQRYILALVAFSLDSLAWYVCGGRNTNGEESTVEDCQVHNWESGNVEVHKIWLSGVDECLWYGVICSGDGVVRKLELMANDLIGELPPEIGQLYSLQYLAFPGNCLYGTLPRELGSMQELLGLELHGNGMSGPFPQELYNMSQLVLLNLAMQYQSNNQCYRSNGDVVNTAYEKGEAANGPNYGFSGRILGPDLALWVSLQGLYLFDNSFSGTIATEIGDLENLEFLRANNNIFTGVIPESLVKLTNLKQLDLSKNELWSDLPGEIGLMANLEILRVNDNEMLRG